MSGLCPETRQGSSAPLDPSPKGEALWDLLMALMRGVANRGLARSMSATPLINATNGSRGHCPWRGSKGQSPLVGVRGGSPGAHRPQAIALASLVVDVRVTQIANGVLGAHAVLPHGAIG